MYTYLLILFIHFSLSTDVCHQVKPFLGLLCFCTENCPKSKLRSQVLYDVHWMVLWSFPETRMRTVQPNLAQKHRIKITSQYNESMRLTCGSIQVWISPLIMYVIGLTVEITHWRSAWRLTLLRPRVSVFFLFYRDLSCLQVFFFFVFAGFPLLVNLNQCCILCLTAPINGENFGLKFVKPRHAQLSPCLCIDAHMYCMPFY